MKTLGHKSGFVTFDFTPGVMLISIEIFITNKILRRVSWNKIPILVSG